MRTTIRLDEQLLAEAKKRASESGRTLTAVIEDALRESLARKSEPRQGQPIRLKTVVGDGLRPGADLDDAAALLDLMES